MATTYTAELLTTREASTALYLSSAGVRYLVRSGRLTPAPRLGPDGTYLFARADVERLAAERATS